MHKENIFSKKKKFMHRAVAKKKILAQEMGQKKNSGRLKIPHPPPPPHHFSNGPSLNLVCMCVLFYVPTIVILCIDFRCINSKLNFACYTNVIRWRKNLLSHPDNYLCRSIFSYLKDQKVIFISFRKPTLK